MVLNIFDQSNVMTHIMWYKYKWKMVYDMHVMDIQFENWLF